jgi:hypothetical protein
MQVLDPDLDTGYGFNWVGKEKFIHKKKRRKNNKEICLFSTLKVHKHETFVGSDFEFSNFFGFNM